MLDRIRQASAALFIFLLHRLHETVTGQTGEGSNGFEPVDIGKLAVFEGVRQYPLRVKCATLAWHTLRNAIGGKADEVAVTE